jgi:hypothetical protein
VLSSSRVPTVPTGRTSPRHRPLPCRRLRAVTRVLFRAGPNQPWPATCILSIEVIFAGFSVVHPEALPSLTDVQKQCVSISRPARPSAPHPGDLSLFPGSDIVDRDPPVFTSQAGNEAAIWRPVEDGTSSHSQCLAHGGYRTGCQINLMEPGFVFGSRAPGAEHNRRSAVVQPGQAPTTRSHLSQTAEPVGTSFRNNRRLHEAASVLPLSQCRKEVSHL